MQTHILAHGGGMRAAFAAGALYELAKQGVAKVDGITAVSASTPTAAYFAAGQFEEIKQIWCEDLAQAKLVSIKRFYQGKPLVDTHSLINKIFKEKRPLNWNSILKSQIELEFLAYNFVQNKLESFSSRNNFKSLDPWELLQASMTIHNAHLQGEISHLVDSNLIPFSIYNRKWDKNSNYIVIDNFPFWGFGLRQYLGTLLFRIFQGRNFPKQVKEKLRQRHELHAVGLTKFQDFLKECDPVVIKYPKQSGDKPLSTIARSKDKLSFLFELGREEAGKVMNQNMEKVDYFISRAKELV